VGDAHLERHAIARGHAIVVFRGRHVADFTSLTAAEAAAYWLDVHTAARMIEQVFAPCHMNYQLLGNSVPHLHIHLVPRYIDDPAPGRPLPWEPQAVAESEFDSQVRLLMSAARTAANNTPGRVSSPPDAAAMDRMTLLALRTPRLELIAATAETATLETQDLAVFASALDVVPPKSWPPPLHDAGSQAWYLDLLQQDDAVGWGLWYLVVPQHQRQLAGTIGFKGKPVDGSCEIGYSMLPGFAGFGFATEAARRLIAWAFEHPEIEVVAAETPPDVAVSIRVMEKCGMRLVGEGTPEGDVRTVRYAVSRAEFRSPE
jgi:RimJ/RimL family protein N-acetyltransferase/diadenosine tetraphosphate (Ap4A) HIT family hydrolase